MTPDLHPELDDLILNCLGTAPVSGTGEAVRRHCAECADCQAEIERLRRELAWTAMAMPQSTPPASAKQRLFAAAGLELKPEWTSATATARPAGAVIPMQPRRGGTGWLGWAGWAVAAASLLYAFQTQTARTGVERQLRTQTAAAVASRDAGARAEQVLAVLSSPEAQRVTLVAAHTRPEPTGQAVYLPRRGALVFTASNLAPVPADKTYELWVIPASGAAPVPAGTFRPDARGSASILLPKLPHGIAAKQFGVTLENAGGAASPTLPILLAGG